MKGHDRVMAVRAKGRVPRFGVDVQLGEHAPWFDWWEERFPESAHVWIEPSDRVHRLDMRFVVGLMVAVHACGSDEAERAIEVAHRCAECGSSRAVAMCGGQILWDSEAR